MQHSSFQKGSRQIGRRGFLGRVATGGAAGLLVTADPPARANDTAKARGKPIPWKVDITIYDRPGWSSTSYGLPVRKDKSGELVVGFQTQREDTVIDDFYSRRGLDEAGLPIVEKITKRSVKQRPESSSEDGSERDGEGDLE